MAEKLNPQRLAWILALALALSVGFQPSAALAASAPRKDNLAIRSWPSISTSTILADVVRQMEPALTDFFTTWSFDMVTQTQSRLENKYKRYRLSVNFDVSKDAKLFVTVKISGKRYCYTNVGANSIRLKSSKRCS